MKSALVSDPEFSCHSLAKESFGGTEVRYGGAAVLTEVSVKKTDLPIVVAFHNSEQVCIVVPATPMREILCILNEAIKLA